MRLPHRIYFLPYNNVIWHIKLPNTARALDPTLTMATALRKGERYSDGAHAGADRQVSGLLPSALLLFYDTCGCDSPVQGTGSQTCLQIVSPLVERGAP